MRAAPFFGDDRASSRRVLFDLLGYETHQPVVDTFHQSVKPHRIISAPARTSKSYAAAPEIVHDFFPEVDADARAQGVWKAMERETICWIVAMDYDNAKEWDYAWQYLIDSNIIESIGGKIEAQTNSPKQGNMRIVVKWPFPTVGAQVARSILQVKTASNEKTLQGEEVKTCILSESAEHEERIVRKYLLTRCQNIIYPTTPKRKALWLYEMIQAGEETEDLGIEHFQFTRFCNPRYDHERYERSRRKAELTYGSAQEDPEFMEQFEGSWTFDGGKVIPFRWVEDGRPTNVVQRIPTWVAAGTWYVSLDYGYTDPAVALFWAVSETGEMVLVNEIYEKNLNPMAFVEMIEERVEDLSIRVKQVIPDPQQPMVTDILRKHGLPLWDRRKASEVRDRAGGFEALRDAMAIDPATGRPTMRVYEPGCPRTVAEWKAIRFKDNATNEFATGAIHGEDHATDAARYFLMSRPKADVGERDWVRDFQARSAEAQRWRERAMESEHVLRGRNPSIFEAV
jgi:hypothetical protein